MEATVRVDDDKAKPAAGPRPEEGASQAPPNIDLEGEAGDEEMADEPAPDEEFEEILSKLDPAAQAAIKKRQATIAEHATKRAKAGPTGQVQQLQEATLAFGRLVASTSGGAWRSAPYP